MEECDECTVIRPGFGAEGIRACDAHLGFGGGVKHIRERLGEMDAD